MGKYLPALRSRMADAECRGDAVALGRLCDAIEVDRPELVQLDAAITELDRLLVEEATGFRLDDLYTKVPEPLPGLVELTYDRFNRPGVRFLEAALYASHLYDPALQAMSLRRIDPDEPGDGMRVPRLAGPGMMVLPAPFVSPVWDVVGRARRGGVPARELAAALGIMLTDLAPLVTTRAPERVAVPPAAGARARFLGHACVLFEAPSGSTVLLDPLVAHRRPGCDDRFSFPDLPDRIDCVAITHAHLDHFDIDLPDRGCALVVVEGVRTLAAVEKKSWNRLAAGQSFYLSWEWLRPVEDIPGMETEYLIAYRDGSMVGALPTYVDRRRVMTRYQPDSVLDGSSCQ